ncbi:MAG: DNA repair protein RecO [Candidatus Staskawiczbacteria bacterium]
MTAKYKTKAFVLKKSDRNESDRIFSVFTDEFGKLNIFAKAIRKSTSKLRSGIDIFFMSEIEFIQGKNRKTLTDTSIVKKFSSISKDVKKFQIANGIGEILDNFIKGEERDKGVFDLLDEVFCELNSQNSTTGKHTLLYYYFLWNALSIFGYLPEVEKCNSCHNKLSPDIFYFSNILGGVICEKCLGHDVSAKKININSVKLLRLIFKKEWKLLSKLKIDSVSKSLFKKMSDDYYMYTLSTHSFKNISRVSAEVV